MLSKRLRICAWNINGYNSRIIGIKLLDKEFLRVLRDVDLVCLTETHMHTEILEHLNIPGFQLLGYKNYKKNVKSNTARGGIAIFVKENVMKLFTILKTDNEDIIWTKIKKELTGTNRDIFIATCYLSPAKEKPNIPSKISKLREEALLFQAKGHVIINGDLNAWTGNANDTIQPDKFDDNFHISSNDPPPTRNSMHKATNKRGLELLDTCKSLELYILNGRKVGDPFGQFTSFQAQGNSVVDYLITTSAISNEIAMLKVGDFVPWLSDHCPLLYDLEINEGLDKSSLEKPLKPAPKQYVWSDKGVQKFIDELQNSRNKERLRHAFLMDYTDPSNVVEYISDFLIDVAASAKIKSIPKNPKKNEDPPWFDDECTKLKKKTTLLGKKRKRFPNCDITRNELSKAKKTLKKTVQQNKIKFKNTLMQEMSLKKKDTKTFWKLLEKLGQKKSDDVIKECISSNKWTEHFKGVLHNPNTYKPLPQNTYTEMVNLITLYAMKK